MSATVRRFALVNDYDFLLAEVYDQSLVAPLVELVLQTNERLWVDCSSFGDDDRPASWFVTMHEIEIGSSWFRQDQDTANTRAERHQARLRARMDAVLPVAVAPAAESER